MDGLRLYINSGLVASAVVTTYWAAINWVNCVTVRGCLSGCGNCSAGSGDQISASLFAGAVADFRVYSSELSANAVCILFVYS